VLLLDEPVNGLDPEGVAWIRALLRSLAAEGRTVLVSSHLMSEMEHTADRLVIIGRGQLITQAPIGELLAAGSGSYVRVRSPQAAGLAAVLEASGATVTRQGDGTLAVTGASTDAIGELARVSGFTLAELSAQQASLEDRYMELTRDTADYRAAGTVPAAGK
jgi:ABC-2 type transport system ATP-binding protein